jgi:hypothetical protein
MMYEVKGDGDDDDDGDDLNAKHEAHSGDVWTLIIRPS